MTFKNFYDNLTALLEKYPQAAEFKTIYAIDDEGNAFREVEFHPTLGKLQNGEFEDNSISPDAVCIN